MKILLLEDDTMMGEAITKHVESTGHVVTLVKDGDEALELITKKNYDLLLLDINVPGIDGLSLLEALHGQKIQVPTIFISALVDIEDISRAFNLGCYDYLKKPFHLKELSLRIDRLLQSRQVPQAHKRLSKSYSYDSETMTLLFNNEPYILPRRQLQIIELLARHRSRVVDYDMFREYVWNDDMIDNATIRAELNRVKKALKEDFIINVRSIGYTIERPRS